MNGFRACCILALFATSGCATGPAAPARADYTMAGCWLDRDPLRCQYPTPDGCQKLAENIFKCGAPTDDSAAK